MPGKQTLIACTCTLILMVLLMIGCQEQAAESTIEPLEEDIQDSQDIIPVENSEKDISPPLNENNNNNGKDKNAHISSSQDPEKTNEDLEKTNQDAEKSNTEETTTDVNISEPDYGVAIPYNPSKPTLMGLTINQSKNEITTKFGIPNEEYVMEDPSDPITVYEYTGFLIGFNKKNLIAFVDVNSSEVNPGLNGLKLGNSIDAAIQALGIPDTRTEYVMNYKSEDVNLKLDIDPNNNTINSIKLFGIN
jgi:hypothetical protein